MTLEKLKEYGAIKKEIEGLEEKIEELRIKAEGVGAVNTEKPAVKGSTNNWTEEARILYTDMRTAYIEKLSHLNNEQMKIERAIEKLPGIDRNIMRRRYIDGETLEYIATKVGYSKRQVIRRIQISLVKIKNK